MVLGRSSAALVHSPSRRAGSHHRRCLGEGAGRQGDRRLPRRRRRSWCDPNGRSEAKVLGGPRGAYSRASPARSRSCGTSRSSASAVAHRSPTSVASSLRPGPLPHRRPDRKVRTSQGAPREGGVPGENGGRAPSPRSMTGGASGWSRRRRSSGSATRRSPGTTSSPHEPPPYLPKELRTVPRSNIEFLPIKDAWFSGSMNYLGRSGRRGGNLNTRRRTRSTHRSRSRSRSSPSSSLTRSSGHVTTFAYSRISTSGRGSVSRRRFSP